MMLKYREHQCHGRIVGTLVGVIGNFVGKNETEFNVNPHVATQLQEGCSGDTDNLVGHGKVELRGSDKGRTGLVGGVVAYSYGTIQHLKTASFCPLR